MKTIHTTMILHAVALLAFGAMALAAVNRDAARQADHYQCGSDSDCAQLGGNGDPAPAR